MKLKLFQKQDLARAALKDGLILSWDTGLGKTWALYLWPLLKAGFDQVPPDPNRLSVRERLRPKAPALIIAPGDLHQQIAEEGLAYFGIVIRKLESQDAFMRLTQVPGTAQTNLSPDGRPIVPPAFYITSYTQLTTNGVNKFPDADDWQPRALLEWLSLPIGEHQPTMDPAETKDGKRLPLPDSFTDVCNHFAWRGFIWRDEYDLFNLDPRHTFADLEKAFQREEAGLAYWQDEKAAEEQRERIHAAFEILKNLMCSKRDPKYTDLSDRQQDFVIRHFCAAKIKEYSVNAGEYAEYPIGPIPSGFDPAKPETDSRPKRRVKCVFSPSLADLSYTAFDCVVIDEGVKMKGEDTLVGRGVRSMAPRCRLVLTATPIKNRLPDIFRLAWWATGGKAEAHARFPYRDDPTERSKFAETFMVTERNLTREAEEKGKKKSASRFKKQTAEVCNVHRLWKLFGPIVLRRRKQDAGEDIVPKVRRVVRCEMGSLQKKVYGYHLEAEYRDINGLPAIGAQLQALRIAAADPSSTHLVAQPGAPSEDCDCHLENGIVQRHCPRCHGRGTVPLPSRSGTAYVPKMATVLTIIHEILERQEQAIIFSAFNDPLDHLSRWLFEAGVRHVVLDGRVSQKKRGEKAALFKKGRADEYSIPIMLAGVECMAEGHSFHLANNVVLLAYSWAADKFKQALDRVHRLNSVKPVNIYVVICTGTIDRKLESLTDEKTNAAELVLDGRLIGERSEEINLAELLKVAKREFNEKDNTLDEALLQTEWPRLRDRLGGAMRRWNIDAPSEPKLFMPTIRTQPRPKPQDQSAVSAPSDQPDNIIQLPLPPKFGVPASAGSDKPAWTKRLAQRRRDLWSQL